MGNNDPTSSRDRSFSPLPRSGSGLSDALGPVSGEYSFTPPVSEPAFNQTESLTTTTVPQQNLPAKAKSTPSRSSTR